MEYICLNCGHITESLTCPNCYHIMSEDEYNKVIEKHKSLYDMAIIIEKRQKRT